MRAEARMDVVVLGRLGAGLARWRAHRGGAVQGIGALEEELLNGRFKTVSKEAVCGD